MAIEFRDCGDCTICCEGHLIGNSYGNRFGNGKKCIFLVQKNCTIYKDRPETCRKYQCAWTQHILPEWMKPNQCGLMVSVQDEPSGKQYLKAIEIRADVSQNVYDELEKFCKENNTYFMKVPYNESQSRFWS